MVNHFYTFGKSVQIPRRCSKLNNKVVFKYLPRSRKNYPKSTPKIFKGRFFARKHGFSVIDIGQIIIYDDENCQKCDLCLIIILLKLL